jgi:hypothetical protein
MAPIPVVCDACGQLWAAEQLIGVGGGGVVQVQFEDVGVGPCPHCGGTGHVPDGIYKLGETVTRYLGALDQTEMKTLLQLATEARTQKLTAAEVATRIEEQVPKASSLAAMLKDGATPVAAWLAVLIALLTWLHPLTEKQQTGPTAQQMEHAFAQALEQVQAVGPQQRGRLPKRVAIPKLARKKSERPVTAKTERPRLGPGESCWCGSGKKHKHCHGK